jgi:hypothetical protein
LSKLSATSCVSKIVAAATMVPSMGIQQTGAPFPPTRGLKLSDEVFELAGSRAPPRAPERQRGLWSFLTWSFVIAPIVTTETFFAKNAYAFGQAADDQNNSGAGLDKGPAGATADNSPSAVAAVIADDARDDNADASRLIGAVRPASHDGFSQYDQNPVHIGLHDTDAASAPAGGGGGGGGGGPNDAAASDAGASSGNVVGLQASDLTNETLGGLPGQSPSSGENPYGLLNGLAVDASASEGLIDVSAGNEPIVVQIVSLGQGLLPGERSNDLSHEIAVGASSAGGLHVDVAGGLRVDVSVGKEPILPEVVSLGESLLSGDGGLHVGISVGAEPSLAPTTFDINSAVTTGLPDILSLDTAVKDVLGFDLHVNGAGEFVANDLTTALDVNPSQLVADVSTTTGPATEDLPRLDFGASKALDDLLGKGLLDVGHLSDAISEPSSVVATSASDLGSDASAALEKVSAPALSISHESGSNTNPSMVSTVSDVPHLGIVGEATDLTPGHSVDFPAQPVPEGDALFSGTSYTDYHVALNTAVSSSAANGTIATTTTVTNTHDVASASPVDSPNASHASEPPAPEHQDVSLTQLSNAVDDLSVRGHSH